MPGPRKKHTRKPPPPPEVDERYFDEWFDFGFGVLCGYLGKYAEFNQLYPERPEEPLDDPALD